MNKINKPQRIQIGKNLIEDDDLDGYSIYLFGILSLYKDKDTQQCFPSLDTLAENTKSSKKTVINRLSNLKDKGYITITKRGNKGNLYTLIRPPKLLKDKEEFTFEFMKRDDLTIEEKIFFICTAPKTTKDINTGIGEMRNVSVNSIARLCGFSWGNANKLIDGLKKKETIELNNNNLKIDYTKISQAILFMAAKIEENSEDIVKLKSNHEITNNRVSKLESEVAFLRKELLKNNIKDIEYETI